MDIANCAKLKGAMLSDSTGREMSANGMDRPCSCPQIAGAPKLEEHAHEPQSHRQPFDCNWHRYW